MAYTKKHVQIMQAYVQVTGEGCDDVWREYGVFRRWREPRWAEGAVLKKIFEELPWAPDNAEWVGGHDPDAWTPQWSEAYHKLPTQTVNPCGNCRSERTCTAICPARAKWWDTKMEELRNG